MTSRVFVIADLHFGHRKVAEARGFFGTGFHDDAIVTAWNKVVTKRDVVYVLGDVFQLDRIPELNGTLKLAMGNHDNKAIERYAKLFSQVRGCFEFDGCLLSHIPVHPDQLQRYELNVHGHTHGAVVGDLRYIPVSVEHCAELEPVLLRELIQLRRKRLSGFGAVGVRDPENPCSEFLPGKPSPSSQCETDGHYLCDECEHKRVREDNED